MSNETEPTNYKRSNNIYLQIFYWEFYTFLKGLETILNRLYTVNIHLIICGDININHLDSNGGGGGGNN
jgi:exonuclease III